MGRTLLTAEELYEAKRTYTENLSLPALVEEVYFGLTGTGSMSFSYKNSRGLIFANNGYLGSQPDNRDYYLLWQISCHHSQECRFNPSCEPNFQAAATAIKESWKRFVGD